MSYFAENYKISALISGDQEYACTACDATFRYPNTLKAHVRFHCPRSSMTSWIGQYSPLQTGSLLSAYQQELSKYFSHLGTLWSLRKMAIPDLGLPLLHPNVDRTSAMAAAAAATALTRSAFRPCTTASSYTNGNSSPLFSPSHSPLVSRKKLSDKSNAENVADRKRNSDDGAPNGTTATTTTTPIVGYPTQSPIPSYLDKMYMYNYAQYMRTDVPQFPVDLTSSLRRLPLAHGTEFSPVSGSDTPTGSRERPCGRQEENKSPASDRDSPSKPPVTALNFPMPSDTAGEPIDLLPKSLYMSKAYKGHLCIYCGKLYSRKYGLKIHLRTHTGYKPLKCKVCLRPFGDPSNLNKHIRLHAEGDTPYRCEHCGKVLVRRRDLERHVKSRHPNHAAGDCGGAAAGLVAAHLDEHSDADTSFIDVDDDVDDDDVADDDDVGRCASPIDMRRQEIEVT